MYYDQFFSKRRNQNSHDRMVNSLVDILSQQNYTNIKADLVLYSKPENINGYIPDATARMLFAEYIFEVETSDTIDIEHTKQQFIAFNNYARASANRNFIVGVPFGYEQKAKDVLRRLGISAAVWSLN